MKVNDDAQESRKNLLIEKLTQKRNIVDKKATELRTVRNELNSQSKEHFKARNEYNHEVKKLVKKRLEQKEIRETMNLEVKERKKVRNEANKKIKDAKKVLKSSTEVSKSQADLKAGIAEQEDAHSEVLDAVKQAQNAHERMLEYQEEIKSIRDLAEAAHRKLRLSKREADQAHRTYILSLRCLHSIQDISRARKELERGVEPKRSARQDIQEDSTEPDIPESEPDQFTDEQIEEIKKTIVEYYNNPKWSKRGFLLSENIKTIQIQKNKFLIHAKSPGVLIGKRGGRIIPLQEKLGQQFGSIDIRIKELKKDSRELSKAASRLK